MSLRDYLVYDVKPGIYPDMSGSEYARSAGISKHVLDKIHRSPAHLVASCIGDGVQSDALKFGIAFHMAALDKEAFDSTYELVPFFDRRTKSGRESYAAWTKDHAASRKISLTQDDMTAILKMRTSLHNNAKVSRWIEDCCHEVSIFKKLSGVLCKCRFDGWSAKDGIAFDIKTTRDASKRSFAKFTADFRYHVQDAFSRALTEKALFPIAHFYFICVEKEPPYALAVYELDAESVAEGARLYQEDLDKYKTALESGNWGAYPACVQTLSLPRWAYGL